MHEFGSADAYVSDDSQDMLISGDRGSLQSDSTAQGRPSANPRMVEASVLGRTTHLDDDDDDDRDARSHSFADSTGRSSIGSATRRWNPNAWLPFRQGYDYRNLAGSEEDGDLSSNLLADELTTDDQNLDILEKLQLDEAYDHTSLADDDEDILRTEDDELANAYSAIQTDWVRSQQSPRPLQQSGMRTRRIRPQARAHSENWVKMSKYESLDYEQSVNVPFLRAQSIAYLPKRDRTELTQDPRDSFSVFNGSTGLPAGHGEQEWGLRSESSATTATGGRSGGGGGGSSSLVYKKPRKGLCGYTGRTLSRWIMTWVEGLAIGMVAYSLHSLVELLTLQRNSAVFGVSGEFTFPGLLLFTVWNLAMVAAASAMAVYWAPGASGSGIPETKAYLNGVSIRNFFTLEVFIAKFFGTALAVASGMMVGPEGPLVHLGALVGSGLTSGRKTIQAFGKQYSAQFPLLMQFRSAKDRRDFISIGAAAGFAAAFGAPVGGVLFALEETCSFWSPILMWRTLTATLLTTFSLLMFESYITNEANGTASISTALNSYGLISLSTAEDCNVQEIPLFIVIGAFGGVLGAFFNKTWSYKMSHLPSKRRDKVLLICGISVFTSIMLYVLPFALKSLSCAELSQMTAVDDGGDDSVTDYTEFWLQYGCPEGETNLLASLFFGLRDKAIKELLQNSNHIHGTVLCISFIVLFPLMIASFSLAIPSGMFLPSILCGALGGALFAKVVTQFDSLLSLFAVSADQLMDNCALIGAVALLGGIQRSTVSLCVIIMEGTGQVNLLLPIIITTVVARFVGNWFNHGLYETAITLKDIPFLENHIHHNYYLMRVANVMATDVKCLRPFETVRSICELLQSCTHNGFPVVAGESKKLCGIILRSQLRMILRRKLFVPSTRSPKHEVETRGRSVSVEEALQVPLHATDADATPSEAALVENLSNRDLDCEVNIVRIMNQGPHVVLESCPLSRAYSLFITVGLRHLVVIDGDGSVKGMITRKDLFDIQNYRPVPRRYTGHRLTTDLIPHSVSSVLLNENDQQQAGATSTPQRRVANPFRSSSLGAPSGEP